MRPLAALLACLTLAAGPAQMPEAERRGREALSRALKALRVETLPRMWAVEGYGRENLEAELQGRNPLERTWRTHQEWVAVDRGDDSVAWRRWTPRNDDSLRHRTFIYRPAETHIVDHEAGFFRSIPGDVPASRRRALMRRIPHLFLADLASRGASRVRWLPGVPDRPYDDIQVDVPGEGPYDMAIGQDGSLIAIRYALDFPGRGNVPVSWNWYDWKPHAELGLIPSRHLLEIDFHLYQEVTYSRYDARDHMNDVAMAMTRDGYHPLGDGRPTTPAPSWAAAAGPAEGEVAPGVHVARIGGFTILSRTSDDRSSRSKRPKRRRGWNRSPRRTARRRGRSPPR